MRNIEYAKKRESEKGLKQENVKERVSETEERKRKTETERRD